MAITLTVYSVPWHELREVPGSRRRKLVAEIERNYGPRQSLDTMFGAVGSPWTLAEAINRCADR